MTTEERARFVLSGGVPMGRSGWDEFNARLVAAIRDAENDALERAALTVEEFGISAVACRCHECHPLAWIEAAKHLRSLKLEPVRPRASGEAGDEG